ncbi:MAG TPA: response regulator [Candidatus Bathyarchaeia archaeon]|nr:response regulator [Candidatus Bathyarchaeia archaeon]
MGARLILIVEAEAAVRQSLVDVLSLEGHEVDGASDAEMVLLLLEQRRYDLVVADLRMADLHGPKLLAALQERAGADPLPRLVFMTHLTFDPEYGGFLADLRVPVITKPLRPGRVLELVGRLLET